MSKRHVFTILGVQKFCYKDRNFSVSLHLIDRFWFFWISTEMWNNISSSGQIQIHTTETFYQFWLKRKHCILSLMITWNNGPDVFSRSWLTIYFIRKSWRDTALDNLFIASNVPGCSKYNEVEFHFGALSKSLGQVIMPGSFKYFNLKVQI